jgi:hypothetical protein
MLCMVKVATNPPTQWTVYKACKLYGCTAGQLADEDYEIVRQHLNIERTLDKHAGS